MEQQFSANPFGARDKASRTEVRRSQDDLINAGRATQRQRAGGAVDALRHATQRQSQPAEPVHDGQRQPVEEG